MTERFWSSELEYLAMLRQVIDAQTPIHRWADGYHEWSPSFETWQAFMVGYSAGWKSALAALDGSQAEQIAAEYVTSQEDRDREYEAEVAREEHAKWVRRRSDLPSVVPSENAFDAYWQEAEASLGKRWRLHVWRSSESDVPYVAEAIKNTRRKIRGQGWTPAGAVKALIEAIDALPQE